MTKEKHQIRLGAAAVYTRAKMVFSKFALAWPFRRTRHTTKGPAVNSAILLCEALETRLAPAAFVWDPVSPPVPFPARFQTPEPPGLLWSEYKNWLVLDQDGDWKRSTGSVPGDDPARLDDVRFVGQMKWQKNTLLGPVDRAGLTHLEVVTR